MDDKKILLSSLFHDIGKVLERTKKFEKQELPPEFQKISYGHPRYSALLVRVIRENSDKNFPKFLVENLTEEVEDIVLNHHNPTNEYGLIVQIADWLSSSEREEKEEQKGEYTNIPLSAPFKRIDENADDLFYPLTTLENIFPKKEVKIDPYEYDKLFNEFLNKLKYVEDFEQLLLLYEYYFSNVPAQTVGFEPDISIYDHSRITTALSHILYKNYTNGILTREDLEKIKKGLQSQKRDNTQDNIFDKKLFTFINGDLSGIQSFLFNVSSERAGRMLKGKSIFLDLLTRYSAKYILENTGFSQVNAIYIGGGNFELLLSYIPEDILKKLRSFIIENLWKLLEEDLYLGIEWSYLSINDLFNFIEKKRELKDKLEIRKKSRFKEIENFYDLIISPKNEDIKEREHCTVCGKRKIEDASPQERWCSTCKSFIELANKAIESEYLIEEKIEINKNYPESVFDFFETLGYSLSFSKDPFKSKNTRIYKLEDISIDKNFIPHGFLLGSYRIEITDFEKIAKSNIKKIDSEEYGDKKLAYLKMDADNMGSIFKELSEKEKERIKNKETTISLTRYGILSRRIELFFEKEVLNLIKECQKQKENQTSEKDKKGYIYPVFIGGDDLFIIGTYDEINELALKIHSKYKEYTGSKNVFTISGSIYYLPDNFPLIRGASLIEEGLEKAKSFKYPEEEKPQKGKICIEEDILTYREFEEALKISEKLTKGILKMSKEKYSRAVISKIQRSIKGFNPLLEASLKGKISPPAIWRFMYYLRDYKDLAENLSKILLTNLFERGEEKIRNPRLIIVATKIAKMKTRRGREQ
uniref:Type III-A CRISPR-associated protein Cas10/Csm1 n=1 Tax=Dictyoglomus thermophilum TaxID=14 RepID=A0A7C3MPF3_DICTH